MQILLIVNNPDNWPLHVSGVRVVSARRYLTDPSFNTMRHVRIFNLCRSYSYQSLGYYVSLLAEARGHKPQPDIVTIQDMKSATVSRILADELDELIQSTLRPIRSDRFELSIYFGKTTAKRDRSLGLRLFGLFPSPLLRAQFIRKGRWQWQGVRPIPSSEIPENHRQSVIDAASEYFTRRQWTGRRAARAKYHMAILHDPNEREPTSDEKALDRFIRAAGKHEMAAQLITRDDYGRIGEYDALFIRTTTAVNHYTFRFARRAQADGLAVIDDPVSIARCTNKVYLAERLTQRGIATPPTCIIHRENAAAIPDELGLPLVLKQPDSAFSMGVIKVEDEHTYKHQVERLLAKSDLIVAQSFVPTGYDWRVGVLDGQALYVCRYHMARHHWQIMKHDHDGGTDYGRIDTMAVADAPKRVVSTAVKAAALMGDGLYGVDLKQINGKVYIIEVNDNPSIDAGYEDRVLKAELYEHIIKSFIRRIERIRQGDSARDRR